MSEPTFLIRQEQPGDRDAIEAVVESAFGSPREARLVEAIRASPEYIPALALVGEMDGEIVAHVMVSFTSLAEGVVRHRILHLSPLSVVQSRQRQGIGSTLVEAVVNAARATGAGFVVLQGSPRYYGRLGFEPAGPYGISMNLPEWASPEAAQIRLLVSDPPVIRGHVVDPSSFDVLSQS